MFLLDKIEKDGVYENFPVLEGENSDQWSQCDAAGLISALGIECMNEHWQLRLGDSEICVQIEFTRANPEEGLILLKDYARRFFEYAQEAITTMSPRYQEIYENIIADFLSNGVTTPIHGKLI